jgi:uncharacterized protein (DUF1778 family)
MYTKDKNARITLRLNEQQFDFVKLNADFLGVSPSEFLRMVINASMATSKLAEEKLTSDLLSHLDNITDKGGRGRENDKADFDNFL